MKKLAIIAAAMGGALLLFSVTLLPILVRNKACESIQQATGRTVRIESVTIQPFTLAIKATGIVMEEKGGAPFFACATLRARISPASIYSGTLILGEIILESPSLNITRTAPGRYSFSDISEHRQTLKQPVRKEPLIVAINSVTVTNGSVQFSDDVPKGGFKSSLTGINFGLKHFTTAAASSAEYTLSLLLDNEARLSSTGSFSLSPLALQTSTEVTQLNLQKGWPYLARYMTAPLKGSLDLSGEVRYSKVDGLSAKNGRATVTDLTTRYGKKERLDIESLLVNGVSYTQKENSLEIDEIQLSKGNASVSREADGRISLSSLLATHQNPPRIKMLPAAWHADNMLEADSASVHDRAKAFTYRLKRVQVDRFNLLFSDKTRREKPTFTLRETSMVLANLGGPNFTPAQLHFSTIFGKKSPLKGGGEITPHPFHYRGDINVARLPISAFEDYFPENLKVKIVDGYLDSAVNVDITLKNGKPTGTFKGSSGVRSFHSIDMLAEEDLLKWESLQLDEFRGSLEPFILDVRKIALNGVYSRIIVRKDGTLNLQNLVQKPISSAISEHKGMSAAQGRIDSAKRSQVSIGTVTIQDGTLAFSDTNLPQQFATTFHNLGGRISGLSSETLKFADVDLRGNLESQSPLQITGKINPLRNDLFADLKISFKDIELSPVSPYSGRYLGYTIEKGKLYLDLKYHIENKLLTSDNKIFIDQFTFGTRVESDKATSLPVQLGLAVLKDSRGEIHLDVPVIGRTDDPELSVWKLAWQVLKNVLVKAVTSPLTLLSSLFGNNDDFGSIPFNYGTSVVTTEEELKLTELSKALLDRPALKMELKGYVDREKDTEGYRHELLNRKLKNEKYLRLGRTGGLKAVEKIEPTRILPEEYVTYLAAAYKKETFPKPRTVLGLIKELPPAEMEKLIIVNTVVGEHELHLLARERAVAVMNYLVKKGNVPAERIFINDDNVFKSPEKKSTSQSRVEVVAIAN